MVIRERHRSALASSQVRAPWAEVVKERVDRLYRGEFEALFDEAAATAELAGPRSSQVDSVSHFPKKISIWAKWSRSTKNRQKSTKSIRCRFLSIGETSSVRKAVELAHLGKVSETFGALTSGGVLPLEEAAVREGSRDGTAGATHCAQRSRLGSGEVTLALRGPLGKGLSDGIRDATAPTTESVCGWPRVWARARGSPCWRC